MKMAIRHEYQSYGVDDFYKKHGNNYENPHFFKIKKLIEKDVLKLNLDFSHVLDLCAGSGEMTEILKNHAGKIDGIDPYTQEAYQKRTGKTAESFTFSDIGSGALNNRKYSLIVCSFALHLAPLSRLHNIAYNLSTISRNLLIITPHKKPEIKEEMGWKIENEFLLDKVRARVYLSTNNL